MHTFIYLPNENKIMYNRIEVAPHGDLPASPSFILLTLRENVKIFHHPKCK